MVDNIPEESCTNNVNEISEDLTNMSNRNPNSSGDLSFDTVDGLVSDLGMMCDIKILEIANVLQQKVMYISGGKDKEGHPLILCSTSPILASISEEIFKKAVIYLEKTACVLWENQKFVIIVDSQNDKWANVKVLMKLLEDFEPRYIHYVLLIKPQGFVQRHFSVKDTKQLQEFTKHAIVVLESLDKLYNYVELKELPADLGGSHNFNINEWMEYTTAIERFQKTCLKLGNGVKDVVNLFNKKRSLTLVEEVESLYKQQEQFVEDISDDLRCTVEIFNTLEPIVNKPYKVLLRDQSLLEKYNSAQLQVCSERLQFLSQYLQNIWKKQKMYLDQAKEVCQFELSFNATAKKLKQITEILESRTDIGDSLSSAKDLLEELNDFEIKRKEPYEEMMQLKEKGIAILVLFLPFAHQSVTNCNFEMQNLCKDFESKLEMRRNLLQVSLDVFMCLDKLHEWCQAGVDLLDAQPMECFTSENLASKCFSEVELFMKNGQGINLKKMNQINTLCAKLQNKFLYEKVEQALKRMAEVKLLLERREASLKKVVNPVRPVQPVKALIPEQPSSPALSKSREKELSLDLKLSDEIKSRVVDDASRKKSVLNSPGFSPGFDKSEIKVVSMDDIEKLKRNTFRKSLRKSVKRPISSPSELEEAESEEDPGNRVKIRHVTTELVNTEVDYVNDLAVVMQSYFKSFDDPKYDIPDHIRSQKHIVFGNIEEIYNFHSKVFLQDLIRCRNNPYLAGQIFINKKEEFQLYATYCKNKPSSEELRKELHQTPFLIECQKELGHQLNLDSYLLKPVQRVTKYRLLLTEMLKYVSENHLAHADIKEALQTMKVVLRHVNDVMHSTGLVGLAEDLNKQGKLLLQDSFLVWERKKNTISQFKLSGGKQRQIFVFEKCLIFSKREYDNDKALGTYQCKLFLKTADIGVTETVKGHECKLEIWLQKKTEVYTLQAPNLEVKQVLIAELRKVLMSQFTSEKEIINRKIAPDDMVMADPSNLKKSYFDEYDGNSPNQSPTQSIFSNNKILRKSGMNSMKRAQMNPVKFFANDSDTIMDNSSDESCSDLSENEFEENEADVVDTAFNKNNNEENFIALAEYNSVEDSEMSLKEGEVVSVIKEGEGGWWYCSSTLSGKKGYAPSGYLQKASLYKDVKFEPVKPLSPSPRNRIETIV